MKDFFEQIAAIAKGLWGIISNLGKLVWLAVTSVWPILTLTISLLVALIPWIVSALEMVNSQTGAFWQILTNSAQQYNAMLASGWPPAFAEGVSFVNAYVPIGEAAGMVAVLGTMYVAMSVIRIVMSIIRGI